jgi:hypothetical protein
LAFGLLSKYVKILRTAYYYYYNTTTTTTTILAGVIALTGSGPYPTSYPMDTKGYFPNVKRPECEADHSPPSSAEVTKMYTYTSTHPYAFTA